MTVLALLGELKQELGITHDRHDGALLSRLKAAHEVAESMVGASLYPGTVVDEVVGDAPILQRRPVTAVSGATYLGSSVLSWLTFRPSGVLTGARPGMLVSYSYGQVGPSDAQRMGIVLIAAHLWRTRGGVTSTSLQDPEAEDAPVPGFGFAIPNQARDLLRPPASGPVIA